MNLEKRIDLLAQLGEYLQSATPTWTAAKQKAYAENGWFIPEFIDSAVQSIATQFLQKDKLTTWAEKYQLPAEQPAPKTIGLIMAGNIPLVGFHDMLAIFISGHYQLIKTSTRDQVLIHHIREWMIAKAPELSTCINIAERLNNCDAYIATGSNNSARYFDYYFGKYPHIIRRNRTSVAILTGQETPAELDALADDVNQYFGLGCRNVTKLFVPENYDFLPLLNALKKYDHLADLAKYKHNYDYQLTLLLLNKKYYMTNGTILLTENESPFSPISVLHYQYYQSASAAASTTAPAAGTSNPTSANPTSSNPTSPNPPAEPATRPTNGTSPNPGIYLAEPTAIPPGAATTSIPTYAPTRTAPTTTLPTAPDDNIQCLVGHTHTPFGQAQQPTLDDYADGVDTLQFLRDL